MKKNEVTTAQSTEAAVVYNANEWGDVVVESKDLILPKILLQQALSEAVKQRVARDGDYLNTLTGTVCSNEGGNVHILPFYCKQSYVIEKWNGKKFEFLKIAPNIPGEQKPFEETIGTERFKNSHVYEFFCMTEEGGTPAIVSFRSTSHRAGKQLFNLMYLQNPQQKKTPAHNWIILGSKAETNDMGTFNVMTINIGRESTKEEISSCLGWITTIKQSDFKVADEKAPSTTTETRF
jgi:hypothetical protein